MKSNTITYLDLLLLILIIFFSCCNREEEPGRIIYTDASQPVEERVEDLLGRMRLDQKISQMILIERSNLNSDEEITSFNIGALYSGGVIVPTDNSPAFWADIIDHYQSLALENELGIPILYGTDAVHGHNNVKGAVIFPHNIGLGCTRNPSLVEQAARITALEIKGTGINWTFGPCVAVPRDERWGRTYEGFAETPELTGQMAAAMIKGLQGSISGILFPSWHAPSIILVTGEHLMERITGI